MEPQPPLSLVDQHTPGVANIDITEEATCRKWYKQWHFQAVCRSSARVGGVQAHSEQVDSSRDVILGEVGEQNILPGNPWALELRTKDVNSALTLGQSWQWFSKQSGETLVSTSLLPSDLYFERPRHSSPSSTMEGYRGIEERHARSRVGDLYCERTEQTPAWTTSYCWTQTGATYRSGQPQGT